MSHSRRFDLWGWYYWFEWRCTYNRFLSLTSSNNCAKTCSLKRPSPTITTRRCCSCAEGRFAPPNPRAKKTPKIQPSLLLMDMIGLNFKPSSTSSKSGKLSEINNKKRISKWDYAQSVFSTGLLARLWAPPVSFFCTILLLKVLAAAQLLELLSVCSPLHAAKHSLPFFNTTCLAPPYFLLPTAFSKFNLHNRIYCRTCTHWRWVCALCVRPPTSFSHHDIVLLCHSASGRSSYYEPQSRRTGTGDG